MKKLLFLVGIIFLLIFSIFKVSVSNADDLRRINPNEDKRCLTFVVTFNAHNFSGQSIQVGCQGLRIPSGKTEKDSPCSGNLITIRPNETKRIFNCACPFNAAGDPKPWADGCLYVAQKLNRISDPNRKNRPGISLNQALPGNCQINTNKFELVKDDSGKVISDGYYKTYGKKACGKNGQALAIPISLTCPGVPNTFTPTPRETSTPTLTPTTAICPALSPVTGVHISCPNCSASPTAVPTTAPTSVPTDTLTPTTSGVAPTTAATATLTPTGGSQQ